MKSIVKDLKNDKGFTLIELMVVVVIIGLLAAVALPKFIEQTGKARISRAQADLQAMKTVLTLWASDEGKNKFPNGTELGGVLSSGGIDWAKIKDPWGKGYGYWVENNGKSFTIASKGPDGQSGGNDDIIVKDDLPPTSGQSAPSNSPASTSGADSW